MVKPDPKLINRRAFLAAYKEYAQLYTQKQYAKCLDVYPKLDLKAHYSEYKEQIEFVLRSASHSLHSIQNAKDEKKIAVANGFIDVFAQLAENYDYSKILSLLNSKEMDIYLPLFTNISSSKFNFNRWLQNVNEHLFCALNKSNIIGDANFKSEKFIEVYLQLTSTFLYVMKGETQRIITAKSQWKFSGSKQFLDNCMNCQLFNLGEPQHNECLKVFRKFLAFMESGDENNQLTEHIQKFRSQLRDVVKNVRRTLVRDTYIVLARATKICEQRFIELFNVKTCALLLDFIGDIGKGAIQYKTEKRYICSCEATHIHLSHEITLLAVNQFVRIVGNCPESLAALQLGKILNRNFKAVGELTCSKAQNVQHFATNALRGIMKACDNKETAQLAIEVLKPILKHYKEVKLMEGVPYFDEIYVISYLFKANNCAENWNAAVDVGYLLMALMSVPEPMPNFENTAWTVAKIQRDQKYLKSPYDHFHQINSGKLYDFDKPTDFNLTKFSLAYLRVGIKYGVMPTELSNKIVHQLLMVESRDGSNPLRLVLIVNSMTFDRFTTERVEILIKAWQAKGDKDRSIGLQLAAFEYYKFNHDVSEWTEKHKNMHISQALSEEAQTSNTNIFKEITFDIETRQINTLRYIKQKFIDFTEYYINKSDVDRMPFEVEKDYLLRELKMVANQFIVRGYIDDGLDLYMALHRFSTVVNDEFGMIDACSFFAECSVEFERKFPLENLNEIVKGCFDNMIKKLKVLADLPTRKQNQVGFCLLNLVLYYHENGGKEIYSKQIHTILLFIFTSIGGIRDKNMGDSLKATTGFSIPTSNNATKVPKIDSEAVRIKFYSVLFTIVTKYNAPSSFCPSRFLCFMMQHIKKYINVYHDITAAVPILLCNIIPQMITWLNSIYEINANSQSVVLTLLKLAVRSGYALRTAGLIMTTMQISLLTEDLKYCKTLFMALESIMLSPTNKQHAAQTNVVSNVDNDGYLCEPIRKQGVITSPIKNIRPSPTVGGFQAGEIKFLQKHSKSCDCGPCSSSEMRFQMFCAAVSYARYVYINEDDFNKEIMRSVFKQLLSFWEKHHTDKSKFPRTDMFYVTSARMFLYFGHYLWKFDVNSREKAVEQLERGLKGLQKVKHRACLIEQDLTFQIRDMKDTIEEKKAPREKKYLKYIRKFDDEPDDEPMKKPVALEKKIPKPPPSLLEMINGAPAPSINFQIHDDGNGPGASSVVTPNVKKSTRNRLKRTEETSFRTPSHRAKPQEATSQTAERPKRSTRLQLLTPTVLSKEKSREK